MRLAEDDVKPSTVNRGVSFLRRMFNLAIRDGIWASNPASGKRVPKLPEQRSIKFLDETDDAAIFSALEAYGREGPGAHYHQARPLGGLDRAAEIAVLTGMRAGEQFQMRRDQVQFGSGVIVLPQTKTRRARYLPLTPRLVELFEEQLDSHKSEWVWPGKDPSRPRDARAANRALKDMCEYAGVRVITWHGLRHSFGVRGVQRGDIMAVKELLGHASLQTTDIYTHVVASRLRSTMMAVSETGGRFKKSAQSGSGIVDPATAVGLQEKTAVGRKTLPFRGKRSQAT